MGERMFGFGIENDGGESDGGENVEAKSIVGIGVKHGDSPIPVNGRPVHGSLWPV